jgi:hypothetical protein
LQRVEAREAVLLFDDDFDNGDEPYGVAERGSDFRVEPDGCVSGALGGAPYC